jgi:2'-5' RNA ligase
VTRTAGLTPSDQTALLIVAPLPDPLEALRRRSIHDASEGMPAHVTLLYPFAEPAALRENLLHAVAGVVAQHPACSLRLVDGRRWPDTLYVAVEPDGPLRALQADLATAFPELPLYWGGVPFVPHVSVVEGPAVSDPDALEDPAWRSLPATIPARHVDLFVRDAGRWRRRHRFPLRPA